ncbi:uncharacterized protein BcabD6B2_26760 [Babesia caballi]|uniref:Guanylate-binding protein N-terminal domain-containing protein n=1 Tax=Babesia caballi TaxID=5871 RepID=A0AAV4LST3_BABCB|nr:hypothetical protein, conserved [Babesia caballi]
MYPALGRVPRRAAGAVIAGVLWYCTCVSALEGAAAGRPDRGGGGGFTAFGEPCAGEGCQFDETPVDGNAAKFCLTEGPWSGEPVQLVRPAANRLGLELVEDGIRVLRSIPKPIAIVAAIGSVKTGKSSLLNVLNENVLCAEEDVAGFKVSDSVDATTRGIWMWSKPMEVECRALRERTGDDESETKFFDHLVTVVDSLLGGILKAKVTAKSRVDLSRCDVEKVNVVVVDVEGFNAADGFRGYDEALFTIAATMSTELIYLTHKVIDARDMMDLQHMLQTANSTLVHLYRSLFNLPRVSGSYGEEGQSYNGVSVVKQRVSAEGGPCEACDAEAALGENAVFDAFREVMLQMQRDTTLTMSVQGFNLQLQQSALDYINGVINGKRFNLSYGDQQSFLDYVSQTREKIVRFFKKNPDPSKHSPERRADDTVMRLTSEYNYVMPQLFNSIDVLFTSALPKKSGVSCGYLAQILNYKKRLFKRSVMQPKKKFSPVLNAMTHMAGEDLGELLGYLVNALNESMKTGTDCMGDFRLTRANLVKNDLVELYSAELWEYVHKQPIPLEGDLEEFNRGARGKYFEIMALYAQYDLSPDKYDGIRAEFEERLQKLRAVVGEKLRDVTLQYCRSNVSAVQKSIRDRVAEFKLPVMPSVIDAFERDKHELVSWYRAAVDKEAKYSNTAACSGVAAEIVEFVDTQIRELYAENEREVNMLFQEATRRAVEFFIASSDRNSVEKYRVPHKDFVETLRSWESGAYDVYYREVGEFKSLDAFDQPALRFLKKQVSLLGNESRDHWNDVCRTAALQVLHKFKSTFDTHLHQLVPFRPAAKPVLNMAIEYLRLRGWNEMDGLYCSESQHVESTRQSFNRMIDEARARTLKSNDASMFRHFDKEFKILGQEALERVGHVYHFYQLKKHIQWYARWHIFSQTKGFYQLLRPGRAVEELQKSLDAGILKSVPADRASPEIRALQQLGEANGATDAAHAPTVDVFRHGVCCGVLAACGERAKAACGVLSARDQHGGTRVHPGSGQLPGAEQHGDALRRPLGGRGRGQAGGCVEPCRLLGAVGGGGGVVLAQVPDGGPDEGASAREARVWVRRHAQTTRGTPSRLLLGLVQKGAEAERVGGLLDELHGGGALHLGSVGEGRHACSLVGAQGLLEALVGVLVNADDAAVGEQRLVVDVVGLVLAGVETGVEAGSRVEQPCVVGVWNLARDRLAEGDALADVAIASSSSLDLLAGTLEAHFALNLPLAFKLGSLELAVDVEPGTLLAGTSGQGAQLLLLLLSLPNLLHAMGLVAEPDLLASRALGKRHAFGQHSELLVNVDLLQTAPVGLNALVDRDGVALGVLPVADAGRHLPGELVLLGQLARRGVLQRRRGGGRGCRKLLVPVARRLQRVGLLLHHLNETLVDGLRGLLAGRVAEDFGLAARSGGDGVVLAPTRQRHVEGLASAVEVGVYAVVGRPGQGVLAEVLLTLVSGLRVDDLAGTYAFAHDSVKLGASIWAVPQGERAGALWKSETGHRRKSGEQYAVVLTSRVPLGTASSSCNEKDPAWPLSPDRSSRWL